MNIIPVDTLYYLPDTAVFISEYWIAGEVYNVHTRFSPNEDYGSFSVKEIHYLFSTKAIGDTLKFVNIYKDTLKTLLYSQTVNKVLDSNDVYPNWFIVTLDDSSPEFIDLVEISNYPFSVFSLCITQNCYTSGNTIGFYENSQSWRIVCDKPIKLIIEGKPSNLDDDKKTTPAFQLSQNYPNPFNPNTSIRYSIGSRGFVTLKVYDMLGRELASLVNEEKMPGSYNVIFSVGSFGNARGLSSGVYYYKINVGDFSDVKKLILLR